MTEPVELATEAANVLADRMGVASHDVALVLGSGWGASATLIGSEVASIACEDVPGFRAPTVEGHTATLRSLVTPQGLRILVLGGRHHYYEDRDVATVAHPVRTAAAAGCRIVVLTNGCGSTRPKVGPGTPVLISDHINLTGTTPLIGPHFVDLTDLYSTRLRTLVHTVDPDLPEGVYVQFPGPQYETPAEVRMAITMGADLVGMSTALEAIAARAAGMEVLGLSLVTNFAAGLTHGGLSHAEVLAAGKEAGPRITQLLADIIRKL